MNTVVADLKEPINAVLERFFAETDLTVVITYRHYQGRDASGEDTFMDFPVKVIPSGKRSRIGYAKHRVPVAAGDGCFIIRDMDLPQSITINDLSTKDRIIPEAGTEELPITEIDKTLGFVIEVQTGAG